MSESEAIQTLAAWLSPAYPVGAFAYSHGLETAIADGDIRDTASLYDWIRDILTHGAGRSDAILLAHAFRSPEDAEIADLATALQPSAERLLEAEKQGDAFARTTVAAWGVDVASAPYPVAIGRAAVARGLPLDHTIILYLQAFASNLISAGIRLIPIGQTDGQAVLVRLIPLCRRVAEEATHATLDDIGGLSIRSDIASMKHETQRTRLFRS